jgi:hypothetical protein
MSIKYNTFLLSGNKINFLFLFLLFQLDDVLAELLNILILSD